MHEFSVSWECDSVDAVDAVDAAIEALRILRDPETEALVFKVEGPDGERVEVDLFDHGVRALPRRREPDFAAYLTNYPHPLPSGVSLSNARMLPVSQLNRDDIILGLLGLEPGGNRWSVQPARPRYAMPGPACGKCSSMCALNALYADLTGRHAMHTTAVGREVIDPEGTEGETVYLTAFAEDICLAILKR